ncbi:MAG: Cu2+-exporting ATPase [archaeon GW2011_AR19]|nr:MAG: Cu2+-exporting ATPase [archaeon GW2011_AR19]
MKKIKITINGMHCASCASNVEKSLKKVPGVKNANVSLMLKKGTAECEDSVSEDEIKKAVVRTGYKISNIEKE